jgi:autotransporter-associated beta strand protein
MCAKEGISSFSKFIVDAPLFGLILIVGPPQRAETAQIVSVGGTHLSHQPLKVESMKKALLEAGKSIPWMIAVGAIALTASQFAIATNLFWSANGTAQGGAGTWNTTTANRFGNSAGGPFNLTWNNANTDSAEFGGTAGQINLGGPITVNLITTDLAGFNIGNANTAGTGGNNTINFTGAGAGVFTNYASGTTTLSAVIGANNVVTKTGTGRMEMGNGNNPNTVKYVLNGGAMTSASIARLSNTAPGSLVQDFFTFNGGGWGINTGNQDTTATRGVTIKSGGAFFGSSVVTINMTISSPIVGTEGGGITVTNVGPFVGNNHQAGVLLILNNATATPNSWDGSLTIASGSVRENLSNQVPDTALVTQSAGTTFDLGTAGVTDTVKSISGAGGTIALGSAGKLTVNAPGGESAQQVITGTAGSQLIKNGSGALSLTGSSTNFSGEVVLNNGTLGIGGANALGSNAAGPTFQINGGKISNTAASGRNMSANLKVNVNADFTADDSLAATQGQITFQGVSTLVGGSKTITVNGTANIAFDDLRETVAGSNLTKDGAGTLALTGTNTANAFTGDVEVKAGRLQVSGTSIIGTGNNTVKLNGGALNSSANRSISSNPVSNPINVVADSAITTTSAAATVNMAFTSDSITGTSGKTLTLRNDGGADNTKLFMPRFMGSGFDFQSNIAVVSSGTGAKTQLQFANTGTTVQTFSGDISGDGSLYRTSGSVGSGNGGTTALTGNNTYTGGTTVDEGTLLANNTAGSATGTGDVTVLGGKFGGTGSITGSVILTGGKLSPGGSIESLGTGAVSFGAGTTFEYELNSGLAVSVAADLLNANGNLTIDPTTILSITDAGSTKVPLGTKLTLISYSGAWVQPSGNAQPNHFAGLPNGSSFVLGQNQWNIRYDDSPGGSNFGGGDYSKFVTITAVPEASTFITVGLGGIFAVASIWMSKRLGINVLKA